MSPTCQSVEKSASQSQVCAETVPPGRVRLSVEHSVGAALASVMISVRAMTCMISFVVRPDPSATAEISAVASGAHSCRRR